MLPITFRYGHLLLGMQYDKTRMATGFTRGQTSGWSPSLITHIICRTIIVNSHFQYHCRQIGTYLVHVEEVMKVGNIVMH